MSNRGEEGATLPFTPAPSAPADDASFLRRVLEAIPAFVLRLDHEQGIRYRQIIGRTVHGFVAPEAVQRFEQAISEALSTGRHCSYLVTDADTLQSGTPTLDAGCGDSDGRRDACTVALRYRIPCNQRMAELVGSGPIPLPECVDRFIQPDHRSMMAQELIDARDGRPNDPEHRITRADGQVRGFAALNFSKWGLTQPCPTHGLTCAHELPMNPSPMAHVRDDMTYGTAALSAETGTKERADESNRPT